VTVYADTPGSAAHPCLLALETRPCFFKPPYLQDMRAGMGGAPREMAPRLPLSQSQPLRTLKSCAGIVIVSVKVWLLRRWRPAQGFFETLMAEERQ